MDDKQSGLISALHERPTEWSAPLYIASRSLSYDLTEMPRMQPIRRTNRSNILLCKQFALFHVFHRKQRTPELEAIGLARPWRKLHRPKSLFSGTHCLHHRLEFLRLQREPCIRPTI